MSSRIRYNLIENTPAQRLARPGGTSATRPRASPMNLRSHSLETRIEKIKQQITALGDLRPGNLTKQYNVCGKPDCCCKATPPIKHGPYYQLSFTWKGQSKSQFVRRQDLAVVKKQIRNYRRLRQLLDRWMVLAMELSRRRLQQQPNRAVSPQKRGGNRQFPRKHEGSGAIFGTGNAA